MNQKSSSLAMRMMNQMSSSREEDQETQQQQQQQQQQQIELPPGFRFHPTDEELITHYLSPKVLNHNFNAIAIGEADLNKSEPWDLPGRAKMGEKEWYFFCVKDRKYPTGLRTNRATESGYWKATGKDKEIFRGKRVVGMKKTLVFYRGRAPKGEKSNWVMHEYRLEGKFPLSPNLLKSSTKNEWVICRIFNKSSGDKRTHISELLTVKTGPFGTDRNSPAALPPLMEYCNSQTPYSSQARAAPPRVTCFSNNQPMAMELETKPYTTLLTNTNIDMLYNFKTNHFSASSTSTNPPPQPFSFPNPSPPAPALALNPADSVWMPAGNSIVRMLLENNQTTASGYKVNPKVEISQYPQGFSHGIGMMEEDHHNPSSASDDPIDLESLWNY